MKKNILYISLFFLISLSPAYSLNIKYSNSVKSKDKYSNKKEFEKNIKNIKQKIKKMKKYKEYNYNFLKKFILENNKKTNLQTDEVFIDDSQKRLTYISKKTKKGVSNKYNSKDYEDFAFDYLAKYFPNILNDNEKLKILYFAKDEYFEEVTDDKGNYTGETICKTYSFTIRIIREFLEMPIFNSSVIFEISAEDNEILLYDFLNWFSFQDIEKKNFKNAKLEIINKKINNSFKNKKFINLCEEIEKNSIIEDITIEDIKMGWIIDHNTLIPVFSHYETIHYIDKETGKEANYPLSSLELWDTQQ